MFRTQIGKTSSLVLTLCGVLKDILLVAASMIIFRDPVSPLQFFGYSIALGGLVYYKLGAEQIKGYFGGGQRAWAEYGAKHPALRKLIIFGLVIFTIFLILGGLGGTGNLPSGYTDYATSKVNDLLNGGSLGKPAGGQ